MATNEGIDPREVLVVFRAGMPGDAFARLRNEYRVTAMAPPRIAVVAGVEDIERLTRRPDVEAVMTTMSDAAPDSLTDAELLFVNGWRARHQSGVKSRTGDGLAWDAPGFLPPDEPHER
jgi:hypothetical protein